MHRSFATLSKSKSSLIKNTTNRTHSIEYRKIFKNRVTHTKQNNVKSYSKFIELEKQEVPQNELQNMKEFVKTFKKNEEVSLNDKDNISMKNSRCTSQKSVRSCYSHQFKTTSKEFKNVVETRKPTLAQLEAKIEKILEQKLIQSQNKQFILQALRNGEIDHVDKDLNDFIQEIKQLKQEVQAENDETEHISYIRKKIEIIEKILAQSFTQSQLMKKYFYSCQSIRKSLQNLPNNKQTKHKKQPLKKISSNPSIISKPALYHQSQNQLNYKKHAKKQYQKNKISSLKHFLNRQPLPRSSYNNDFLSYGSLPKYTHPSKGKYEATPLTQKKTSSYQDQFKAKKVENLNQKQLDCTLDKIKRLKISFMPEMKKIKSNSPQVTLRRLVHNKETENQYKLVPMKPITKTEFKREFIKKNVVIQNPIKNKQLSNMKYNLKRTLYA